MRKLSYNWGEWLTRFLAVAALIVSIDVWLDQKEMNEWQRQMQIEETKVHINLKGVWIDSLLFVKELKPVAYDSDTIIMGIDSYVLLTISNESNRPIGIDRMRWYWKSTSGLGHQSWNSRFISSNFLEEITYPIVIEPYKPFNMITRIPIPINTTMGLYLTDIVNDTTYLSRHIIAAIFHEYIKTQVLEGEISISEIENIVKDIPILYSMYRSIPSFLMNYRFESEGEQYRDKHFIRLSIHLTSGDKMIKTLDYFDINSYSIIY